MVKTGPKTAGQLLGYFDLKSKVEPKALAIKPGLLGLVRAHQKLIQTTSDKFYLKGSTNLFKSPNISLVQLNKELSLGSGQGSDKLKSSFFSLPQVISTYRNWFGDCTVSSKF